MTNSERCLSRYAITFAVALFVSCACLTYFGSKVDNEESKFDAVVSHETKVYPDKPVYVLDEAVVVCVEVMNPCDFKIVLDLKCARLAHQRGAPGLFIAEIAPRQEDPNSGMFVFAGKPWHFIDARRVSRCKITIPATTPLVHGKNKFQYEFLAPYTQFRSENDDMIIIKPIPPAIWDDTWNAGAHTLETICGKRGKIYAVGELEFWVQEQKDVKE